MRAYPLSALDTGITRQREKGGASPKALYDLLNGYVDSAGAPTSRYGTTFDVTLPTGTKGLCAFKGKLHVFALTAIDPGSALVVVEILIHPDPSFTGTLDAIYFAKPFLGYLYVVAGFSDGLIQHYWQQSVNPWQASKVYQITDSVQPTTPNGFLYKPTSSDNPDAWQPSKAYGVGSVVQPTVYNGFKYTVIEADGANPSSSTTEPTWPATDGAQVIEDVDLNPGDAPAPPPAPTSPGSPAGPRYDTNLGERLHTQTGIQ